MLKRCIMIFPEFENEHTVDKIREKYDPLATHVRAHITLVFPFDSEIGTDELRGHLISAVEGVKPFEFSLKGIEAVNSFGNYLFLNIKTGNDEIKMLHERLYEGLLSGFYPEWLSRVEFRPHMTVGKLPDDETLQKAAIEVSNISEDFATTVDKISVEIIDENEDSIIEMVIPLKN